MPQDNSEKNNNTPMTAEEKDFEGHQRVRASKLQKFRKRLKWYHYVAIIVLILLILPFVIWHLLPKHELNVSILDKTVLSYSNDEKIIKENVYRKHQGLEWILNQQRYVKPDGTKYDYKTDYYGPMLDEEGAYDHTVNLGDSTERPDMIYLSDAYGLGNDTFGHYNGSSPLDGGISDDDMSYVSFAYESGAPIIGEATLFSSPLSDSVRSQLMTMFGVKPTKWIGRYLFDLEDFTDVPDWAPPMYEQQEGVEWRFTGPGILLVSNDGEIIILEQNTDFNSKNLLQIYINEEYKKEFGSCGKCNFYNWFELIEPNYGTEEIATFYFDLNATGMEKIKDVSRTPYFCAITRKQEKGYAPAYYFSGDCNDYVSGKRYGDFVFSDWLFRFFSYDRQGDISNFFWRFYTPLMNRILSETKSTVYTEEAEEHQEVTRVNGGSFQILEDEKWRSISLKSTAINAQEPGKDSYSRDFTFYENLINEAGELGANCIEAKALLPPEFYTAVSRYNKNHDRPIYILQTVTAPEGTEIADYLTDDGLAQWKYAITSTIKALHGEGSAEGVLLGKASYFIDVSAYVLGVTVDPELSSDNIKKIKGLSSYSYEGEHTKKNTGANGFAAYLYDTAQSFSYDTYGYYTPVAVRSEMGMVKGLSFVKDDNAYLFDGIAVDDCEDYYFNDIAVDSKLVSGIGDKKDSTGTKYKKAFTEVNQKAAPALATGVSFSNINAVFGQDAVSESDQGMNIVDVLTCARDSELLGATVYDLNDSWAENTEEMKFYTAGESNSYLWHNTCDAKQMTGVIAEDSVMPETPGLMLSDDDIVQVVSLYSDAGYMYITLQLLEELDYKTYAMFIGLDTYQRNDGEYYYAKDFTPNSLSGMEFTLRFESKQDAALYVMRDYDRNKGSAATKERYTGDYDKVADLTYGGFNVGDNQFYQTGSTIYIRLPWNWLNVADPSKKLVINDDDFDGEYAKTVTTNGVLSSVMIGERKEGDLISAFPEDKHDPGYKVFMWEKWEKVEYTSRHKESYEILKNYFAELS